MVTFGLRITTFLTNYIVLLAFIYLYDWLQTDDKRSWIMRFRTPLLVSVTCAFLIFFHTTSVLSIINQEHAIGYGWTFLNFQIVTIYYALLSTKNRSMIISILILIGAWFTWMPNVADGFTLPIVTFVMLGVVQRYGHTFAKNIFSYSLTGFALAVPFYITNYIYLRGIDVGWPFEIISLTFLILTVWFVNQRLTIHSKHEQELVLDATIDNLTQIANFRSFDTDLHAAYHRYKEQNELYALYTFDIDHFKQINDHYGHLAGNEVLKAVSARINQIVQELEYDARTYRTGGEEFSILLFDVVESMDRAKEISRLLRTEIRKLTFNFGGEEIHITISLGQDRATADDKNYLDLYNRADQFLYSSKNNGRDALTIRGVTMR